MSEMGERVAKAIRKFVDHPDQTDWYTDQEATEAARAAIEAMWEPTEEMIRMGKTASAWHGKGRDCEDVYKSMMVAIMSDEWMERVEERWQSMIDEALK